MNGKSLTKKGKTEAVPPRLALSKVSHVRSELSRLYREARTGKVSLSDATKLTYMLQALGRLIVDHELESRIDALEKQQEVANNGKFGR